MSLTLAVLSWKSYGTLINTLNSYFYRGLDKLADEKLIFFQEISGKDYEIAEEYGYTAIGNSDNIGIAAAYKELVDKTTSDLFLFLENDWVLIENPVKQITDAKQMLNPRPVKFIWNFADVVRLRHRLNPGDPLWTRQFKGNELSRPEHLLDSIHWTDPSQFKEIDTWGSWYVAQAKYANWTNNPTMFRTDWLRQNIVPRLSGDIERAIQPWWQTQTFLVAQSDGLFTHKRID